MRYFMLLDEKKEYADEVTKELQEEIDMLQNIVGEVSADHASTIVEMCQEFHLDKDETIRRLEEKAHMSHQAAVDYVNEHWN